jgi:hypothetical protein
MRAKRVIRPESKATAEELGIADCFARFLPKPNVIIDDHCRERLAALHARTPMSL